VSAGTDRIASWNLRGKSGTKKERLTGALLDRLTHRVHIIEANGESYRLKNAKKRLTTYSNTYIMNPSGASLLDRHPLTSRPAQTDTLLAGAANDLVILADPDSATDIFDGGEGTNDRLLLEAGYGTFTLTSPCGFEEFIGTADNDIVDWSSSTVRVCLRGNGGADILYGEGGINHLTGGTGNDSLRGGGSDYAHYTEEPIPPRYNVRDAGTYFVVTDITGGPTGDGVDIVRGCPEENIVGPYTP